MISEKKVGPGLRGLSLIQNAITIECLGMQLITGEVIALAIASEHVDAKYFIWRIASFFPLNFLLISQNSATVSAERPSENFAVSC